MLEEFLCISAKILHSAVYKQLIHKAREIHITSEIGVNNESSSTA